MGPPARVGAWSRRRVSGRATRAGRPRARHGVPQRDHGPPGPGLGAPAGVRGAPRDRRRRGAAGAPDPHRGRHPLRRGRCDRRDRRDLARGIGSRRHLARGPPRPTRRRSRHRRRGAAVRGRPDHGYRARVQHSSRAAVRPVRVGARAARRRCVRLAAAAALALWPRGRAGRRDERAARRDADRREVVAHVARARARVEWRRCTGGGRGSGAARHGARGGTGVAAGHPDARRGSARRGGRGPGYQVAARRALVVRPCVGAGH